MIKKQAGTLATAMAALTLLAGIGLATPAAHAQPAPPVPANPLARPEATGDHVRPVEPVGDEEKKPLLPSMVDPQTYLEMVWVVVIFVILLAVLYPTAWKNILAGLKKREDRIRRDIADAEAARTKAEATLKDYNVQLAAAQAKVQEMLSQATTDAERIAAGIRTRAQDESEQIKNRANAEIETSRKQAVASIYEQAADLSTSIAEKILRRNLNADDQRDLVNESLSKLQAVEA